MGRSHALTGAAVGVVTSPAAGLVGAPVAAWVAAVVAASILPDVDHPGASIARMWGPLSRVPSRFLSPLLGGHRGVTHAWFAPVLFAAVVALGSLHPVVSVAVWVFGAGVAGAAVGAVRAEPSPVLNVGVSGLVGWLAWRGSWPVLPLALPVALGVVVHLLGDRVPVGSVRERVVVVCSYVAVAAWVAAPVLAEGVVL